MALNDAPNIERDLIEPMEDLSSKSKDLLLSFANFIKKSFGYFGIVLAPTIVFILVFHFEIYDLIFEKDGLYNSSIITGSTALILGYWLYKSALFANEHDTLKKVIKDNLLSFITLSFLIYDISVSFIGYNLNMGFTKEQFYAEKWLIIVFVTLDFILGVKAGYHYYKNNYIEENNTDNENIEESTLNNDESDQLIQQSENSDDVNEINDENQEKGYDNKKMLKFLYWSIGIILMIMVAFYIYNGSS